MKLNFLKNPKAKTIIVVSGCVLALIVILVLIALLYKGKIGGGGANGKNTLASVYITPGITEDSSRRTITNSSLDTEKCIDDICIKNVKITCYADEGLIEYKIRNKGSSAATGYIHLILGDFKALLYYEELGAGVTKTGYYGYKGYNLTSASSYFVQAPSLDDLDFVNDGVTPETDG